MRHRPPFRRDRLEELLREDIITDKEVAITIRRRDRHRRNRPRSHRHHPIKRDWPKKLLELSCNLDSKTNHRSILAILEYHRHLRPWCK